MQQPNMHIREATPDDAAALAALCTELGYPSSEQQVLGRLTRLADRDHSLLVCEYAGGRPVGLLDVHVRALLEEDPYAEVCTLVVTEQARGAGAGKALLDEAARWTRERGLLKLWVRVSLWRERTPHFYESLGFRLRKEQRVFELTL
jgi:ribosomal protein S18 acetylase RimI-like enzyme